MRKLRAFLVLAFAIAVPLGGAASTTFPAPTAPPGTVAAFLVSTRPAAASTAASASASVRGLIVRLRDDPDHVAMAEASPGAASASNGRRRAAAAHSDGRWRALLQATGLGAEPGLRLEPVGRNAWRVVFDGARSPVVVARWTAALARRSEVQWAVPNERETALQASAPTPDDSLFGLAGQWWLLPPGGNNADAMAARLRGVPGFQTAWARTTGSPATVVAVLDSGLAAHPDLDTDRILPGYDMVSDWNSATGIGYANDGDGRDADPTDPGDWVDAADQAADPARYASCAVQASDWHGTAVTGFLGAATNNALGAAAATWSTRILPVRVAGKCGAEVADIVDGMRWAAGLQVCKTFAVAGDASQGCAEWAPINPTPARIVNISFGGTAACNAAYQDAIDELHTLGVIVVAAAGNDHGAPTRPASCNGVVGVAALNRDGFKAFYSNYGAALKIATVGGDDGEGAWGALTDGGLQSLGNDGATVAGLPTYPRHYGTSFAAPIVAGAAALMLAADPTLTADELIAGLQASARPHVTSPTLPSCGDAHPGRCICSTATCGAGILDADQAVAYAQAHATGTAYAPPAWPTLVIANDDISRAVALGVDVAGVGTDTSAGTTTGGATVGSTGGTAGGTTGGTTATGGTTSSSSGGGAVGPFELLALIGCAALLGRRSTRRAGSRRG